MTSSSRQRSTPGQSLPHPSFSSSSSSFCQEMANAESNNRVITGWAARDASGILTPYSYTLRETGPADVLIKVLYCGICHTDIHQAKNHLGMSNYPMVPGHEVVGEVAEVGSKASKFRVGVGVVVGCCRACGPCKANIEQYCNKRIWS